MTSKPVPVGVTVAVSDGSAVKVGLLVCVFVGVLVLVAVTPRVLVAIAFGEGVLLAVPAFLGVCDGVLVLLGELVIVGDGCAVGGTWHVTVRLTPPGGEIPTRT